MNDSRENRYLILNDQKSASQAALMLARFVLLPLFFTSILFLTGCITTGERTITAQKETQPADTSKPEIKQEVIAKPIKANNDKKSVLPLPLTGSEGDESNDDDINADTSAAINETLQENTSLSSTDSLIRPEELIDTFLIDTSSLLPDSLSADSLFADSLLADTVEEKSDDVDTTITYFAERIEFDVKTRTTHLTGKSKLKYKKTTLEAYSIDVDWDHDLMIAEAKYDTVWTDSTETEIDSIAITQEPVFVENNQKLTGLSMKVNMETKQGYVVSGRSDYGEGYYHGQDIQKVSDKVLYVQDGSYTTCEEDKPHYHFGGKQMKMIYRDKVVGKPVILYFGKVPVAALPFAVFSTQSGRHSGILIPTYGDNSRQGRHLRNMGYYWAASDYWDFLYSMDFYEEQGILARGDVKYNIRYKLNGGVSSSYINQSIAGGQRQRWDLKLIHNQDLSPSAKLRVNATFVSDGSYYEETSQNAETRIDKSIRSDATFSKTWPGTRYSFTGNMSHQQNLETDDNSQSLPNMSFRIGSGALFPSKVQKKRKDTGLLYEPPIPRELRKDDDDEDEEKWYNKIMWNYSNKLENRRNEKTVTVNNEEEKNETWTHGVQHTAGINMSGTVAKHFSVTPSVSYREDWLFERRNWHVVAEDDSGNAIDGYAESTQDRGFFQRRTFNFNTSVNTKLYGYFNINRWSVQTIRHVVSPSVRLTYQPDFSDSKWGMYQEVRLPRYDEDGIRIDDEIQSVDIYQSSFFGGSPSGEQMAVSLSLGNLFQMKRIIRNKDGEEEEQKTDLFTYNLSTSYNFVADSLKWRNLGSSFRADPISAKNKIGPLERMSIDVSTTHSFYQFDQEINNQVDKFYWEEEGHGWNFLRMTNLSTSSSFTLSGGNPFAERTKKATVRNYESTEEDTLALTDDGLPSIEDDFDKRFNDPNEGSRANRRSSGSTPWKITGSLRYNLGMNNPMIKNETLRLSGSTNLQLTKKWRFTYSTSYDLIKKQVTSSNLSVTRDLHCWEGRFTWSPQGIGKGFYLNIAIKASQLQDVKVKRQRGNGTIGSLIQ